MKMDAAAALVYVKLYGCTADFPAVTDAEAALVIAGCKCADQYGNSISDDDYEETYMIELAVKNIWELKASKSASLHDMQAGDQSLSRSQIGQKCLEQANIWRRKIPMSSTKMQGRYRWPARFPRGGQVINNTPPEPEVIVTDLATLPTSNALAATHEMTAIEWLEYAEILLYDNANAAAMEHAITGIDWWSITMLTVPPVSNAASCEHAISDIDWWTVPAIEAHDAVNSALLAHAITNIDWWGEPEPGPNEFLNPGFEDGLAWYSIHDDTLPGFTGQVTSTSVAGEFHSGTKGAKLVSGTTDPNVITRLSQDCDSVPGVTYMLSFWCKGDGINDAHFFIYDRTTEINITTEPVAVNNLTTGWKQVVYTFEAPAGATRIRSVLYAPYVVGGTVFYDDLYFGTYAVSDTETFVQRNAAALNHAVTNINWEVTPVPVTTYEQAVAAALTHAITNIDWEIPAVNLWASANPAFETDFANWTKNDTANGNHGTASIATAAGEFYSGTKACKLVADPVTYYETMPWIHRDTTLLPSTNYRLSFWSRGDGTNTGKYFVQDKTTNTAITPTDVSFGNTSDTWQLTTFDFTTPAGASNVRVFLQSSGAIGSTLWIDECFLGRR